MLTTGLIIVGSIAYLNVGVLIGRASQKTWKNYYNNSSWINFLFFPVYTFTDESLGTRPHVASMREKEYLKWMAFVWPFYIAWHAIVLGMGAVVNGLAKTVNALFSLVTLPQSLICKASEQRKLRRQRESEKAKIAIEEQPKAINRLELEQQIEKQAKLIEENTKHYKELTAVLDDMTRGRPNH